jgi:hypothetical protein
MIRYSWPFLEESLLKGETLHGLHEGVGSVVPNAVGAERIGDEHPRVVADVWGERFPCSRRERERMTRHVGSAWAVRSKRIFIVIRIVRKW